MLMRKSHSGIFYGYNPLHDTLHSLAWVDSPSNPSHYSLWLSQVDLCLTHLGIRVQRWAMNLLLQHENHVNSWQVIALNYNMVQYTPLH